MRLRTSSLARIRETWTLAVFSAMNSEAPISRFVRALGEQSEHLALALGEAEGVERPRRSRPPHPGRGLAPRRRRARVASPSISPDSQRAPSPRVVSSASAATAPASSRSPAAASASASRHAAWAIGSGQPTASQAAVAAAHAPRVGGAADAGQLGRGRRPPRLDHRPERGGRRVDVGDQRVGALEGGPLGVGVTEVAGPLGGVGLDGQPGHGDACATAEVGLAAVRQRRPRGVDRGSRRVEVARAAFELGRHGAVRAPEVRLGGARAGARGVVEQHADRVVLAAPERELGAHEVPEDARHPAAAPAGVGQEGVGGRPLAEGDEQVGGGEVQPLALAPAPGDLGGGLADDVERLARAPELVQDVGAVVVAPTRGRSGACSGGPGRPPRADRRTPRSSSPRDMSALPSAFSARLAADASPEARISSSVPSTAAIASP